MVTAFIPHEIMPSLIIHQPPLMFSARVIPWSVHQYRCVKINYSGFTLCREHIQKKPALGPAFSLTFQVKGLEALKRIVKLFFVFFMF